MPASAPLTCPAAVLHLKVVTPNKGESETQLLRKVLTENGSTHNTLARDETEFYLCSGSPKECPGNFSRCSAAPAAPWPMAGSGAMAESAQIKLVN